VVGFPLFNFRFALFGGFWITGIGRDFLQTEASKGVFLSFASDFVPIYAYVFRQRVLTFALEFTIIRGKDAYIFPGLSDIFSKMTFVFGKMKGIRCGIARIFILFPFEFF